MKRAFVLLFLISFLLISGKVVMADTVKEYDENGNCVKEMYFEDGQPLLHDNSYYGLRRLYEDGMCVSITYLDADGNPMLNKSGYAEVRNTFDEAGHVVQEMYYGVNGKPVALLGNQYGLRRSSFDGKGNCTENTYLDIHGNPMMITSGYATVKRTFNDADKVDANMYYDLDNQPVKLSLGQYGDQHIYEGDQDVWITYLGINGEPIKTNSGYTMVKREYEDGRISIEWYYDDAGNQMHLRRGQYGTKFVYDAKGKVEERVPVDRYGKNMFLIDQWLSQHPLAIVLGGLLVIIAGVYLPKKPVLILYILFILYMTLYVREKQDNLQLSIKLFRSVEKALESTDGLKAWSQIVYNILLFVPFGCVLYSICPRASSFLIPILLSVLIEVFQFSTGLGWCELDDVFFNGLGGVIGIGIEMIWIKIRARR